MAVFETIQNSFHDMVKQELTGIANAITTQGAAIVTAVGEVGGKVDDVEKFVTDAMTSVVDVDAYLPGESATAKLAAFRLHVRGEQNKTAHFVEAVKEEKRAAKAVEVEEAQRQRKLNQAAVAADGAEADGEVVTELEVAEPRELADLTTLEVMPEFLTVEEAELVKQIEVSELDARAGKLKRAPKAEFYIGEHPLWYYFGQHKTSLEKQLKMPPWMQSLAARCPGSPNHAIVIKYESGTLNHAPWHSDKSENKGSKSACIVADTGFTVCSVGQPRKFEFGNGGKAVWSQALPDRSMMHVTAAMNADYMHSVPKDAAHVGTRWSLIFRQIKEPVVKVPRAKAAAKPKAAPKRQSLE